MAPRRVVGSGEAQDPVCPALQPWPCSPPHPRFAHGGSLSTMVDETFSKIAYLVAEGLVTLSLNIRFKK